MGKVKHLLVRNFYMHFKEHSVYSLKQKHINKFTNTVILNKLIENIIQRNQ